ncbi:mandelate racemase/muconate lactonizing enzyme family protein [Polynucleobacter sp. IMCC 29146]|uniref:mandelate racemase/muconate lactonizing enzyme family protein n=1 Tax=Polynucleobacter sp. IMCC 29146 TaxID=2780953 RepID=UPI001F41D965|nr:enolase C-terminal domain-like protein [Polynucleobacter sp. IMCC 29146]
MKISHIKLYPLAIPLIEPIKMSGETITHANTLLVYLKTNTGKEAWGETSAAPLMTGETLGGLLQNAKYLGKHLKGLDIPELNSISIALGKILYGNTSVKSCFEMALIDLIAQEQETSVWQILRTLAKNKTQTQPSPLPLLRMLGGSLDKEIAEAARYRAQGYRHWKIKVGILPLAEDLERVSILCNLLDGDTISADANGAFKLQDAVTFCSAEQTRKLSFVEQAISTQSSLNDFSVLKSKSLLPIALDESIHGVSEIVFFDQANALDGASLKLIKTGGLLSGLEAAYELKRRNLKLNLACKVAETSLSAAATASLGFAIDSIPWGFSMSNQYLEFDICPKPLHAENGYLNIEQLNPIGIGVVPEINLITQAHSKEYSPVLC